MHKDSKIYVAGHKGLVGSAILRLLKSEGFSNLLTRTSSELDLRNQAAVHHFFESNQLEYVFLAAARVGGIHANNTFRGEFIYDNLMIQNNVIHASYLNKVKKLLFLGSTCIYPKLSPQPISEDSLLTGKLEPTNEPYAIAKIAGIKLCQAYNNQYGCNFISVMPTNLYGPNDNYDLNNSHVLPALLRKFHEAKKNKSNEVVIWGTGKPLREFLHVDDLADACLFLMNNYSENEIINVGSGEEISIEKLGELIKKIVGYEGKIKQDLSKPDGTPRKAVDSSKILRLGWKPKIKLETGITDTYKVIKSEL